MSTLSAASPRKAHGVGASVLLGGAGGVSPKGSSLVGSHAFSFVSSRPVQQLVHRFLFSMKALIVDPQLELQLLGRIDAPAVLPPALLKLATTYRQAVRLCWTLRRAKGLKVTDLARDFGFNRQHCSDYLNPDDAPHRRNLPPDLIQDFEDVCGNSAISQWIASRAQLTVLEEMQAQRAAA